MEFWRGMFPPAPTFQEKDIGDLHGKVYLVTGGASGVGFELCKMLYSGNGTVYMAGRSQSDADDAISRIKATHPSSEGAIHFLFLDLSDLPGIKATADNFKSKERRLDVAVYNAGVMLPPPGSKTKQGWELQFGTNVLGHFVLQKHLQDIITSTAKIAPEGSVRICWASSGAANVAPNGGVDYNDLEAKGHTSLSWFRNNFIKYAQSKAANNVLAAGYARKFKDSGVISVSFNPGNLKSGLIRHAPSLFALPVWYLLLYDPRFGGLTELYCALSPAIDGSKNGCTVQPWGRIQKYLRDDIEKTLGDDGAEKLWDWCEEKMKEY